MDGSPARSIECPPTCKIATLCSGRSQFARVLAVHPRGEKVKIAAVGEDDRVHMN